MLSLTLKDIPMPLMERLRMRAAVDQRSLNREAIWLLNLALGPSGRAESNPGQEREAQLAAWRTLAGDWQGTHEATDEVVADIYQSRTQGREVTF
ncbi:MAG: hypothetical protein LGR52_08435 [Candidatus Thiosymbion ectosymbiont of Robbea hypermnestra]|nr:hypothetical protein [Candidatus Thiosymbion ectosymbiont of Robbea hypermnestra]